MIAAVAMAKATLESGIVRSLLGLREGFGAGTTGGLNGDIYTVTNLNDSGPGSLRFAAENRTTTPIWIVFDPSLNGKTITLASTIYLGPNRTIDGRGSDITLAGHGLTIGGNWGAGNNIIAGITIEDMNALSEDNITIYGVNNIWVHRVTLSGYGNDGLLDISDGTRNVTVDTSLFRDSDSGMMINSYSTSPGPNDGEVLNGHELGNYARDANTHVTLHDNVFDGVTQRAPRAVFAEVHMYNNLLKDWGAYGIGASFRSEVLAEGNIFDSHGPYGNKAILFQVGIDPEPGFVRAVNNLFLGTASGGSSGASKVFTAPYAYSYDMPTTALKAQLLARAGADGDATLDFATLSPDARIASVYAAFFGRGADADGHAFWIDQHTHGRSLEDIAGLFGNCPEAWGLYPFLVNPASTSNSQIGVFLKDVYDNLFNRPPDAAGLAFWTGKIKQAAQAGQPVGSVLLDIMSGAQDTTAYRDITTLLSKVAVSLEYVEQQDIYDAQWTWADDQAEAIALLDPVTDHGSTVLIGIAQAHALVLADLV
ncbi:MAG: hypothetical protein AB7F22_35785 [Reyranella sp.]|uniref:pectate lyase family protein n=1 Tax=Reyranella sp. TaxID=1929291 RepID=UPI003D0C217C